MCRCTPEIRTPFCGKPGCEWPEQRVDLATRYVIELRGQLPTADPGITTLDAPASRHEWLLACVPEFKDGRLIALTFERRYHAVRDVGRNLGDQEIVTYALLTSEPQRGGSLAV